MSPFIAALVACGGMAAFIVVFGILLPRRDAKEAQHP
jgi:hypothetical protein